MNQENNSFIISPKIIMIGESGVGKTSILFKYIENPNETRATIGVEPLSKDIIYKNRNIKLKLYDTAGQDKFSSISSSFYRGAHGVVFVYDCSDQASFNRIKNYWHDQFQKHNDNQTVVKVLLENKTDVNLHEVSHHDAKNFAHENKMIFLQASAKTGKGIQECFNEVINQLFTLMESETKEGEINPHKGYKVESGSSCCR